MTNEINMEIPADHSMIALMMGHASLLPNALVRGTDGLTAWKRIRGRAFGQPLVGLGESVLYKHPTKGPHHDPQGNVGAQGGEGVFIGYIRSNHTFVVSTEGGQLVHARSVTRRPERERWSADALSKVRVVPTDNKVRQERERVKFQDGATDSGATAEAAAPRPAREMRIDRKDLETHGYDGNCPQCKHILKYGKAQRGQTHTAQCRKKIVEAMSKTESGRLRIEANEERITKTMAEQVEAADRLPPPAIVPGGERGGSAPTHRGFLQRRGAHEESESMPGPSRPHPRDAGVSSSAVPSRLTFEPSGGVPGAMGVPAEEPAGETPDGDDMGRDMEGAAESEDPGNDVGMDSTGTINAVQGIGSLEPSFDDEVSALLHRDGQFR